MKISRYAKFIVSAVMAAGTALTVAMGDDVLTTTEAITVALAVLGSLGVYVVPNAPKAPEVDAAPPRTTF